MASPLLNVYRRSDVTMVRGEGAWLIDEGGTRYLDFAAGIATTSLGHAHPTLVRALQEQSSQLWHCSNLFHTPPLDRFAGRLVGACFADRVFFASSGTEAVEAAIKTIRRHQHAAGNPERTRLIVAEGAFHGRTMGALSACSEARAREGFEPLVPGFDAVAFNDIAALEAAITPQTAGILLETIQGEGGVREHSAEYLRAARALCDRHGLLLALDEIQCGYGRTGALFAFEDAGIVPDIATLAKGIGGGFPLSAMLATERAASGMTPGSHGSTYGSNPLAMAVGDAVLTELLAPGFLPRVAAMGRRLKARLGALVASHRECFTDIRGRGLMLGLGLTRPESKYDFAAALREAGLIVAPAVTGVLRIVPPLIVDETHIDQAVTILEATCRQFKGQKS